MRSDSLLDRYELFTAPAVIAAHANYSTQGFRQKDVKFILDLFADWLGYTLADTILPVKNTQILRYLDKLVNDGYAKRASQNKLPFYKLTRLGLIELINRVVQKKYYHHPAYFFFRYYFLENYKPRIAELIKNEGKLFPLSLKLEIEALLDSKELLKSEIKEVEKEIIKLKGWISEGERACEYAKKLYHRGLTHYAVSEEMERRYPYNLNSQKPLSELLHEVPAEIGQWELSSGAKMRAQHIWKPSLALILSYYIELKKLLEHSHDY